MKPINLFILVHFILYNIFIDIKNHIKHNNKCLKPTTNI